jgi:Mycobacterium membrane protein
MPHPSAPQPPYEPPPEAPVTPPYGSPLPPGYARGRAAPQYPPTAQFPVVNPAPPYAPPRRTRGGLLAGIAAAVIISVLLCIGGIITAVALGRDDGDRDAAPTGPPTPGPATAPADDASPTRPPTETEHVVVYEVTGDGPANVTYVYDARGGTEQIGRADLPWRVETNMGENAFVATVLAIRVGATKGTLTCRLLVDGVEVSTRSSEGRFAAVTCADLVLG